MRRGLSLDAGARACPRPSVQKGAPSNVSNNRSFREEKILVVAFEGWNDAGEAATGAVRALREKLGLQPMFEVATDDYYDYQFTRPVIRTAPSGERVIDWPTTTFYASTSEAAEIIELGDDAEMNVSGANDQNIVVMQGVEPSRRWLEFADDLLSLAKVNGVTRLVFVGALLADVPHTRPIATQATSSNAKLREEFEIERSTYEGPTGIIGVLEHLATEQGFPCLSVWASVPHYVHNAPSPKAILALIDRLEEFLDVTIPRGELLRESAAWEAGIDTIAGEDEDMSAYIQQLEQARDTVDSPEATGEAIAHEFERFLRTGDRSTTADAHPSQTGPVADSSGSEPKDASGDDRETDPQRADQRDPGSGDDTQEPENDGETGRQGDDSTEL